MAAVVILHLDRGYDNRRVRRRPADFGIADVVGAHTRPPGKTAAPRAVPLGLRWAIERTSMRLST